MRAMVLERANEPLELRDLPDPKPGAGQVLIEVEACGVCRTDLHVVEGDLREPKLPLVLGHEAVGVVRELGDGVGGLAPGQRIGVPWLGSSCGGCRYCEGGQENLCDNAGFTGYTLDGGYAQLMVADQRYCFEIPDLYDAAEAAPLLCAGLIGFRSYAMVRERHRLGLYGFGAAAHIIAQIAAHEGHEVFAFTKPGDEAGQVFARTRGASWAGGSDVMPPKELDAAILFAPVGALVPAALGAVRKGGVVVCAGIHMSDIPAFPYQLLWGERTVRSVANLTRQDGIDLFEVAPRVPVRPDVTTFPLADANLALARLRDGDIEGAAVLMP